MKLKGLNFEGDFSYLYEFEKLKIGQDYIEVCEGLELYGIANVDNTPFLIVDKAGTLMDYHAYIKLLGKRSFNP